MQGAERLARRGLHLYRRSIRDTQGIPMSAKPPVAVFDLDGTLVDTAFDLVASLNHVLEQAGFDTVPYLSMRPYAGHGGRAMIERIFAARRMTLRPELLEALIAGFLARYRDTIPGESRAYPGAIAALDRMESAGFRLAVCTNKPQRLADDLLAALNLTSRFAAICGADAFSFRKPDPRHLTETIARAGGDPEASIMIGDSRTDVDTAKAAGIPVIAVSFGYSDVPVRDLEPSIVLADYEELTPALARRLTRTAR